MGLGSIYQKCEESDRVELRGQGAEMACGRAGSSFLPFPRGLKEAAKSILTLYVLHAISFVLWAVLLIVVIAKYSAISKELEQMWTDQLVLKANESNMAKQLEMLHFNQSTMHNTEAELAAELLRLQSDQTTLRVEVFGELAKAKQDRDDIRAETYKIQDAAEKGNDSVCGQCPPDWMRFQRSCYYFSESTKTWADAEAFCLAYRGHLVIVNTKEEQAFLMVNRGPSRVYWLGSTDQKMEAQWHWVDGSSLTFSFWGTGEPNDSQGEDCGSMHTDGRWNDRNCHHTDYWICEKVWLC
ncbi:C-type lectin domain family 4 member G-like [Emydura macquarii macquarii]|uniref:C-type lectin domain family 4 member G-like n=1 Tax=Emydura macquarii macquarii TaxID=1129001 RepID=UPI003529FBAF